MLRKLVMLAAVMIASGVLIIPASSASTPVLTCNIQPNSNDNFLAGQCGTTRPASSYSVDYWLQGQPGSPTYTWSYPTQYAPAMGTCTSTSDVCIITGVRAFKDLSLTATVVVHLNGQQTSYSDTAELNAVCGTMFC